jgi:hypothetical protein
LGGLFEGDGHRRLASAAAEFPARAEHDVAGVDAVELEPVAGAAAVISVSRPGAGVADIEIAIGEIDGEILCHVVGNAGMQGPGEVPFIMGVGVGDAEIGHVHVCVVADPILGVADTAADIGRDALPTSDIPIGIRQRHPGFERGGVFVGAGEIVALIAVQP